MGRDDNVIIFEDTMKMCREHPVLREAMMSSVKAEKLILEGDAVLRTDFAKFDTPANIVVSKKRSFEAAAAYKGMKTMVHNFASATNPGGGVVHGSTAQEECLCRCSTLYPNLNTKEMWDGFYGPHRVAHNPLHNDDCIYTPDVVVFKSDTASPVTMKEEEWYKVDVITCAAPNLRDRPANMMNPGEGNNKISITAQELLALHEKRMGRILDIAVAEGVEVVILGAFGCGAFMNSPEVVAWAMGNVMKEYRNCFKVVEFAVYCSPRDESNFRVFERMMKGM